MTAEQLTIGRLGHTIEFIDCPGVVDGLGAILHGWQLGHLKVPMRAPDVRIRGLADGYRWTSRRLPKPKLWDDIPPKTAMSVVSDVHDVLFDWFMLVRKDLPCLHAGAVALDGGLVCFPSVRRAGKSTLCADLITIGGKLFCDDVLPIDVATRRGLAMGIAPALRRPLPRHGADRLRAFAGGRVALQNEGWSYLRLGRGEIAPFGARALIRHLVLLDRKPRARPRLIEISPAVMLGEMIRQNFGARGHPATVLAALHAVVETARCWRLSYSSLAPAADLVADRLSQA